MKQQYIVIDKDGNKFYYSDRAMTILHREDGPACEYVDGSKLWYLNGKCHREDGPAVERPNGDKLWYLSGKYHRKDGPAVDNSMCEEWYINGNLHREDGPALIYKDGGSYWFVNGENITQEEHARRTKKVPTVNINGKEFTLEQLNSLIKTAEGNKV